MQQEELPTELRLRPSLTKWLVVCGIGILFFAGGILMINTQGDFTAWLVTLFFGAVAAVAVLQIFISSLTLSLDGFEEKSLGGSKKIRWVETSQFGTWKTSGNELVCFDRAKDTGKMASVNRALAGASQSLGDTYSMSAVELAELMNQFRHRKLAELTQKFEESPLSRDLH